MAEINWTAEAQARLRDIYDYIALDDQSAAARTVAGIFLKVQLLKTHPGIGYKCDPTGSREIRIPLYGTTGSPTW